MIGISLVVFGFVVLFLLEHLRPLRNSSRPLGPRMLVNAVITALALAAAALLTKPTAEAMIGYTGERNIGLLYFLPQVPVMQFIAGFALLDLTFYYWHRLNHTLPLLWRFHNAHHIDPDLDVTTSFRFHFVEIGYSSLFRVVQILVIGVPLWVFLIYEICFQLNTLFHHSNVRLPITVERIVNRFLVTPRMHGIHHSQIMSETNSNYSVVLPWWDWMHRTICLNVPQQTIEIGVPAYREPDDNRLMSVLLMPFRPQRHYWRQQDVRYTAALRKPEYKSRMKLCE